jgi:hypothetical protein
MYDVAAVADNRGRRQRDFRAALDRLRHPVLESSLEKLLDVVATTTANVFCFHTTPPPIVHTACCQATADPTTAAKRTRAWCTREKGHSHVGDTDPPQHGRCYPAAVRIPISFPVDTGASCSVSSSEMKVDVICCRRSKTRGCVDCGAKSLGPTVFCWKCAACVLFAILTTRLEP